MENILNRYNIDENALVYNTVAANINICISLTSEDYNFDVRF